MRKSSSLSPELHTKPNREMGRPHDVGGAQGFGPIIVERDEPVFHHDWERRVFGAFFSTWGVVTNLDEVRDARERIDPEVFMASRYYERWVESLEMLIIEKGVATSNEVAAALARVEADPDRPLPSNPDPARVERALRVLYEGGDGWRDVADEPKFSVGDTVWAKAVQPTGHTRLPIYICGHQGRIDAVHGAYVLPDTNHAGAGENPQHVYSVRFASVELWGDDAESDTSVTIDLWECYLEEASR
ncbi:MAG: nitrile hydratase beta subunit [Verrucomicrobiales bacterium]|jgi:nitrile hydratase beta subunit